MLTIIFAFMSKRQAWKTHQLDSSEESDYASLQSDLESDGSLSTSEEEKFRFLQKQRRKRFRQALNEKNKQKIPKIIDPM